MINIPENYSEYIKKLETNGLRKQNEITIITEESKLVIIKFCEKYQTERIINIECPENTLLWTISPHNSIYLDIKDENETEINENVRLMICPMRPSEFINPILRCSYHKLKQFEWKDDLKYFNMIREGDHIIILLKNSPVNIQIENIKFEMTVDSWEKNNKGIMK